MRTFIIFKIDGLTMKIEGIATNTVVCTKLPENITLLLDWI